MTGVQGSESRQYETIKTKYSKQGGRSEGSLIQTRPLKPFERDVHYLIDHFVCKVCSGYEMNLENFADTWASINFTFMLKVCSISLEYRTYIQSLYACALDRLNNPSPLQSYAFLKKQTLTYNNIQIDNNGNKSNNLYCMERSQQQVFQLNAFIPLENQFLPNLNKQQMTSKQMSKSNDGTSETICSNNTDYTRVDLVQVQQFSQSMITQNEQNQTQELQQQTNSQLQIQIPGAQRNQNNGGFLPFLIEDTNKKQVTQKTSQILDDVQGGEGMEVINLNFKETWQKIQYINQVAAIFCLYCLWSCQDRNWNENEKEKENQDDTQSGKQTLQQKLFQQNGKRKRNLQKLFQRNGKRKRNQFVSDDLVSSSEFEELDDEESGRFHEDAHRCINSNGYECNDYIQCDGSRKRQKSNSSQFEDLEKISICLSPDDVTGLVEVVNKSKLLGNFEVMELVKDMRRKNGFIYSLVQRPAAGFTYRCASYTHVIFPARRETENTTLQDIQQHLRKTEASLNAMADDGQNHALHYMNLRNNVLKNTLNFSDAQIEKVSLIKQDDLTQINTKMKSFKTVMQQYLDFKRKLMRENNRRYLLSNKKTQNDVKYKSFQQSSRSFEEAEEEDDEEEEEELTDDDIVSELDFEFNEEDVQDQGNTDIDEDEFQYNAVRSLIPGGKGTINKIMKRKYEKQQEFQSIVQSWVDAIQKPV